MRRIQLVAASIIASGTVLAACGGGSGSGSAIGGVVTIDNESGTLWTCGFNPFNGSVNFLSLGIIYEPLVFQNVLQNGATTPWLASAYSWNSTDTVLTFTIRQGVTWSDGKPFTAGDVVYTFNAMKKNGGLDLNSLWPGEGGPLSSVVQQGSNQVVMTFSAPAAPYFYYVADQTGIVPQHIWSAIGNAVTDKDAAPVGTGPFVMNRCTGQNIEYTRNAHYWQPGLPKIQKVEYPAFTDNGTANNFLASGDAQWGSQYIPNIQAVYSSKSSNRHYWFPPIANVGIFPNLTVAPLNKLAVRQALAYAIDRQKSSSIGESGYEPAANQSGIVTPTFNAWEDKSLLSQYNYSYNPSKAISLLESAGYIRLADGTMVSASGQALSLTVITNNGYSDWLAALNVMKQNLANIGVILNVKSEDATTFDTDLFNGNYQLGYYEEPYVGPSPYYELRELLFSGNTAPIGQTASFNYERFMDPSTDALFNDYAATSSVSTQHQLVAQMEKVMLTQVPFIPVTEGVDWYQYDTTHLGGWVTQSDPYAQPAAFIYPDWEVQLLHLFGQ